MNAKVTVTKSDMSDSKTPFREEIYISQSDNGTRGFCVLDDIHHIRIWVTWPDNTSKV